MSGGSFYHEQYILKDIAQQIAQQIEKHKYCRSDTRYSDETLARFKRAIELLDEAYIYVQRIDWLISDDDGEDFFHKRLAQELAELKSSISKGNV